MQLAAIDWLSISIHLLLVVFVIVCLLMILMVLMQRPKQEGLGAAFGGGVTDQVFGARTTNVLQRGTVYMATLFFVISLTLAVLIGKQNRKITMLGQTAETSQVEEDESTGEAEDAPEADDALPRSLLDELPGEEDAVDPDAETTPEPDPAPPGEETGANSQRGEATGGLIGAAAGGIIGHQSGGALEGAAIGAAAGEIESAGDAEETPEQP